MIELSDVPRSIRDRLWRFSVEKFEAIIQLKILKDLEPLELINGLIAHQAPLNPSRKKCIRRILAELRKISLGDSVVHSQCFIVLNGSEPQPDVAISKRSDSKSEKQLSITVDLELIAQVADASLKTDRTTKLEMYALAGIPIYWIVNLNDRQIEVYTKPKSGKKPGYGKMTRYKPGESVPVIIAGKKRGTIAVSDVMP